MPSTFLETAHAAKILNIVPATVRLLARTGRLPVAARTARGLRLFRQEDVEALLHKRRSTPRASAGSTPGDQTGGQAERDVGVNQR